MPRPRSSCLENLKFGVQLAETAAAERGAATPGLYVFGYNNVARDLRESSGFEHTAVQMRNTVSVR
jgi:hypothetical protein